MPSRVSSCDSDHLPPAIIYMSFHILLCVNVFPGNLCSCCRQTCGVDVLEYEEALGATRALAKDGKRVWIDPDRVNYAFANVVAKDRCVV